MPRFFSVLLVLLLVVPLAACDSGDPMGTQIRTVFISDIEIERAPLMRPDGSDWDDGIIGIGDEPDIYFDLVNDDTGSINASTFGDDFPNVENQDFPLVWVFDPEITFTRFTTQLAFDILDSDDTNNPVESDFMGSTQAFTIQQLIDSGAPSLFTIQSVDGLISVRIRLRYAS